jgi:phospholipase D1/2
MSGKQHNVKTAIQELNKTVKGFWVEMPLDWGYGMTTTPKAPLNANKMIAHNEIDSPKKHDEAIV